MACSIWQASTSATSGSIPRAFRRMFHTVLQNIPHRLYHPEQIPLTSSFQMADQLLLLQSGDGLVHRRFGNAQLVGHIHRAHGRVGRAAKHDDGLEIILVGHGRFHHSNLLIEQVRSS